MLEIFRIGDISKKENYLFYEEFMEKGWKRRRIILYIREFYNIIWHLIL
jgi:hypothetical protein